MVISSEELDRMVKISLDPHNPERKIVVERIKQLSTEDKLLFQKSVVSELLAHKEEKYRNTGEKGLTTFSEKDQEEIRRMVEQKKQQQLEGIKQPEMPLKDMEHKEAVSYLVKLFNARNNKEETKAIEKELEQYKPNERSELKNNLELIEKYFKAKQEEDRDNVIEEIKKLETKYKDIINKVLDIIEEEIERKKVKTEEKVPVPQTKESKDIEEKPKVSFINKSFYSKFISKEEVSPKALKDVIDYVKDNQLEKVTVKDKNTRVFQEKDGKEIVKEIKGKDGYRFEAGVDYKGPTVITIPKLEANGAKSTTDFDIIALDEKGNVAKHRVSPPESNLSTQLDEKWLNSKLDKELEVSSGARVNIKDKKVLVKSGVVSSNNSVITPEEAAAQAKNISAAFVSQPSKSAINPPPKKDKPQGREIS